MNLKILLLLSFGHLVTDIYQGSLPTILPFLKERLSLFSTMAGVLKSLRVAPARSPDFKPLRLHPGNKPPGCHTISSASADRGRQLVVL
jgi:hypothetical protein